MEKQETEKVHSILNRMIPLFDELSEFVKTGKFEVNNGRFEVVFDKKASQEDIGRFDLENWDFWKYMEGVADKNGVGDDPQAAEDYICYLVDEILQNHWEEFHKKMYETKRS